jgi:hypothetical protein
VRLIVKAINEELGKSGSSARIEKGEEYFYSGGEATDCLDRTVNADRLSSFSLDQWMADFREDQETEQKHSAHAGAKGIERGDEARPVPGTSASSPISVEKVVRSS